MNTENQLSTQHTNLESTNLETTNLETTNLESSNLESSNLESSNLESLNLESSNLEIENELLLNKNKLLYYFTEGLTCPEYKINNFCGTTYYTIESLVSSNVKEKESFVKLNKTDKSDVQIDVNVKVDKQKKKPLLYLTGYVNKYINLLDLNEYEKVFIIKELYKDNSNYSICYNSKTPNTFLSEEKLSKCDLNNLELDINNVSVVDINKIEFIYIGEVPRNVFNVGVLFNRFFNDNKQYYENLTSIHEFQSLTESNKPSAAFRKGIYLSNVKENSKDREFNLLRCSSNLDGPTDNFKDIDNDILSKVNNISKYLYTDEVKLNHVLAQTYLNKKIIKETTKIVCERKARIKAHSDKTKDMPKKGLIVFTTFYKDFRLKNGFYTLNKGKNQLRFNNWDYTNYKNVSALTKLKFKLKSCVNDDTLQKEFDITLYPNSVFIISLKTNRLYTHEICPSTLPIDNIPTRMGYIIRCSNTKAVFKNNKTYIIDNLNENFNDTDEKLIDNTKLIELKPLYEEGNVKLKKLYLQENATTDIVYYSGFDFSLNEGDYKQPLL